VCKINPVWCGNQAVKRLKPLVGAVRSCMAVGGSFDRFKRLAAALAKSQDRRASLGVFAFGPDRQGAIANGPAWAAPEKHRPPLHPWQSRPALIERLVKPLVLRWKTRPAVKVNQSLKGTWS